ncbi:MAG: DUF1640 domain-containing protein [Gammaproteobacteria bacterium]|nr:DUF1640 domain-containing protein [Gammaproteobacteria bacterium]
MSSVPFDTHAAVKRLTEAGVTEAQAEALIRAITEANARADLATRGDLNETRHALEADIADLRAEIKGLETRMVKWMIALVAPLYALLIVSLFT